SVSRHPIFIRNRFGLAAKRVCVAFLHPASHRFSLSTCSSHQLRLRFPVLVHSFLNGGNVYVGYPTDPERADFSSQEPAAQTRAQTRCQGASRRRRGTISPHAGSS